MKLKKLLFLTLTLCIIFSGFVIYTFAEEPTEESVEYASESETQSNLDELKNFILNNPDMSCTITYTSDSLVTTGLTYDIAIDQLTETAYITLIPDFDFGYEIYDSPDTEYIDGIRVNGQTVTSLKIPLEVGVTSYDILVKVTYSEGTSGTIAKLFSGNLTFDDFVSSPVLLLQVFYYIIAAISLICSGIGVLKSKKKRVKTAEDIASLVDKRAIEVQQEFSKKFIEIVSNNFIPIINSAVSTNQDVIKAIALSTSKAKTAPIELIELLQKSSNNDTTKALENMKQELSRSIALDDKNHTIIAEQLKNIASTSSQEVIKNAQPTENKATVTEEKSVF